MTQESNTLHILCNGNRHPIVEGTPLESLLRSLDLSPDSVVAEINKKIINRDQYDTTRLFDGDEVELIRFVGGG
jgi:sulfur carrier protein